jgi:hypothetical protein
VCELLQATLGQQRRCTAAAARFDQMCAAGVTPNVVAFNALISACAKGGEESRVRARGSLGVMRRQGLLPDRVSFNAALAAVGRDVAAGELLPPPDLGYRGRRGAVRYRFTVYRRTLPPAPQGVVMV